MHIRRGTAMFGVALLLTMFATVLQPSTASAMPTTGLILNEWNAVASSQILPNGDPFHGDAAGNGGDWFEMVVVEDNLDVRGWQLVASAENIATTTFVFTDDPALSNLRAGTIITVAEDVADDLSFDPASGDWWISLQANRDDEGAYFTADSQGSFNTNNRKWQLTVLDAAGATMFGPAGEGVGDVSGIDADEVGELAADPSAAIAADSGYAESDGSTFGAPNEFAGTVQDFTALRAWFGDGDDVTPPQSTIVSPFNDEVLPTGVGVTISGTTTDDTAVARVRVAVTERGTGLFLQADGTFATTRLFQNATLDAPGTPSTGWTLTADLPDSDYRILVKAVDSSNNAELTVRSAFTVETPSDDVTAPVTVPTVPVNGDVVAGGAPIDLVGATTDDTGVERVQLQVFNIDTSEFLQADGSFGPDRYFTTVVLDSPDAPSTTWTQSVTLPDGKYRVIASANDAAGNRSAARWSFRVRTESMDVTPPESSTTATLNQAVGAVTFAGAATDDMAVAQVRVFVRNRDTGEWVQADGSLGAARAPFAATLTSPGAPATDWTVDTTLPAAGRYRLIVEAIDAAGNAQSPNTSINLLAS